MKRNYIGRKVINKNVLGMYDVILLNREVISTVIGMDGVELILEPLYYINSGLRADINDNVLSKLTNTHNFINSDIKTYIVNHLDEIILIERNSDAGSKTVRKFSYDYYLENRKYYKSLTIKGVAEIQGINVTHQLINYRK
jgi:hypothetical protein